jgi:hypothetical protein
MKNGKKKWNSDNNIVYTTKKQMTEKGEAEVNDIYFYVCGKTDEENEALAANIAMCLNIISEIANK